MTTLKKYLSIYFAIFRASFIADLEYRTNFVTRIVVDIFWYLAQIITFETLFRHTSLIGSWNLEQTRVFLGILFIIDSTYMVLFNDNLDRFSDKIRKGDLDVILAKPVNSQFMVSLQRAATASLGNLTIGLLWFGYSLYKLPDFEVIRLLWMIFLIPCGVFIVYAIRFFFTSTAIIFTRADNLQFLFYQIYKMGMRPDAIYAPWLRFVLITLIPVALVASIPARALLEPPSIPLFVWSALMCLFSLWLSAKFWHRCLKYYSSASS